jgi:hypothetical protein
MPSKKNLRTFGLIWCAIFLLFYLTKHHSYFLGISILFATAACFFPSIFIKTKFYQSWIKFGDFLGRINSFLITALLYFLIFAPLGIFFKIFKKDPLKKTLDKNSSSYFFERTSQPQSMQNQF